MPLFVQNIRIIYSQGPSGAQTEASEEFMERVFVPKAAAGGAQVVPHVVYCDGEGASNVGEAICGFVETNKPSALVVMRENKSPIVKFLLGSVTRFCATHSRAPVVVVPAED
jgi:nucleotide-binding universal stress UspA family protein